MDSEPLHSQHRARLRARYLKDGLAGFAEHEILELLLFYSIPRHDTNAIAHRLLDRFGSLAGVVEAPMELLLQTEGVGPNVTLFFSLLNDLSGEYSRLKALNTKYINSPKEAADYLLNRFPDLRTECVFMLALDGRHKLLFGDIIHEGSINSVEVNLRTITQIALSYKCHSVVLAHNHPSGTARPSPADLTVTSTIEKALGVLGIKLIDHLIVSDDGFVSLAETGCISSSRSIWAQL